MDDNKYIGAEGLQELITLTKNELAKKSDIVQFYTMPDPVEYTGRVVQYVGTPGPEDTFEFGHFYFSIGSTWQEIVVQDEDPEKDIICHYKGRTTVDSLPSADRSNYSDIYRITDASAYGPPNTHVICSTVQGDGSIYEWRSLCGDIDYFRGLHDPDWVNEEYVNFDLIAGKNIITTYTCPKRGIIIGSYTTSASDNGSEPYVRITDSSSDDLTNGIVIYGSPTSCSFNFPVNKGDKVTFYTVLKDGSPSLGRWSTRFVPYKVQ